MVNMNQDTEITDENGQTLWPSPGQKLKKLREEAGYSQEKVAEALYITVHYVKALEEDAYHKLPGLTFVKGYLRSYAGFLKADVPAVLLCYTQYINGQKELEQVNEQAEQSSGVSTQQITWVFVTIVVLALIGVAIWWFSQT